MGIDLLITLEKKGRRQEAGGEGGGRRKEGPKVGTEVVFLSFVTEVVFLSFVGGGVPPVGGLLRNTPSE